MLFHIAMKKKFNPRFKIRYIIMTVQLRLNSLPVKWHQISLLIDYVSCRLSLFNAMSSRVLFPFVFHFLNIIYYRLLFHAVFHFVSLHYIDFCFMLSFTYYCFIVLAFMSCCSSLYY